MDIINWKVIEDNYEISTTGLVRNKNTKKLRKLHNTGGYYTVSLSNKKYLPQETKTFRIHRLVSDNFLDKVEGYTQINHKDGNKLNNNIDNLEWCTSKQNTQHAVDVGLLNNSKRQSYCYTELPLEHFIFYENYCITNTGLVMNIKTNKIKSHWKNGNRMCVSLSKDKIQKQFNVKNIVAKYYLEGYKDGDIIYHKDGDITNNNVDNLAVGTIGDCMKVSKKSKIRKIGQYDLDNKLIREWDSIAEASREIEPNNSRTTAKAISKCLNNQQKTSRGFIWKFLATNGHSDDKNHC